MLEAELYQLVEKIQQNKSEDGALELKAAYGGAPKIYDTLSSFSNQQGGGIIVFGIDERDYSVCGAYDASDLLVKISDQCLQMEPPVRAVCTVVTIDDKQVVSAEIGELEMVYRPCYYKGRGRIQGSYIRVGDADRKMTEYEVYSYEAFRQKINDELRVNERCSMVDIETKALQSYLLRASIEKPKLAELSEKRQLELQGVAKDGAPTLAGVLLFSDYPQSFYPRLCITAVVVDGVEIGELSESGERFIDNKTIEGTLSEMLKEALKFVRRNMKNTTTIDPETGERKDKTQYPITAVREIILNALIHRDYSMHTDSAPVTIVMYKDRIEVENPGGLYGRLTLDTLGTVSADTRNPFIARAMEIQKDTENRFSGIPTIRREMELAKLPQPIFENQRGTFKVTLLNRVEQKKEDAPMGLEQQILAFCKTPRSRDELALEFPHLTKTYLMTNFVNPLVEKGELQLTMPDKPRSKKQGFYCKESV